MSGRHRDNSVAGGHRLGLTTTDVLIEMDQGFVRMIAKHGVSRGTNWWGAREIGAAREAEQAVLSSTKE